MIRLPLRARAQLTTSANRIAFVWALRGTIATALPLLLLPNFGFEQASHFVTIGALNTSMVDVGGSYRSRLNAMALNSILSPVSLVLGSLAQPTWWLATMLMFIVALGSGLARALGPGGTPLGLFVGIAFLIGTSLSDETRQVSEWAALYGAGGLWTILVALVFWRLRPFKRLEQEVAAVWEATTALISALRALDVTSMSVVRRRWQERRLSRQHQGLRDAVERARDTLGGVRAELSGPGTTTAQLIILVRAASRIAAACVTLAEIRRHDARYSNRPAAVTLLDASVDELETACRAVAASLLAGKGKLSLTALRECLENLTATFGATDPEVLAFAQVMRHLENAEETMNLLFGPEHRFSSLVLPPLTRTNPPRHALTAVRAQLSLKSAIFRHALRVAAASAAGTAVMIGLDLPHGLWLPMTALVVLQPEFGGTFSRALQRTAGTVAGAAIAGLLLATLHATMALDLVLVLLLFAAFFVQRRRYGLGVTFLTPLIVLLLATSVGSPWLDTVHRIIDTTAGAALALAAGYLLWPQWERERVPDQLARAIRANRNYMSLIMAALARATAPPEGLGELRRQAEIATGNAEAGFQRLLGEPRIHRGRIARAFALTTYIQRLERHLIALATQLGSVTLPSSDLAVLLQLLESAQDGIAGAIVEGRPPGPCPSFDEPLGRLRAQLISGDPTGSGSTVAFLLGRIVSDTLSLHSAVSTK